MLGAFPVVRKHVPAGSGCYVAHSEAGNRNFGGSGPQQRSEAVRSGRISTPRSVPEGTVVRRLARRTTRSRPT